MLHVVAMLHVVVDVACFCDVACCFLCCMLLRCCMLLLMLHVVNSINICRQHPHATSTFVVGRLPAWH